MNMETFYSKCGELLNHSIIESGIAPQRTFTVKFFYSNGAAEYNGRAWEYILY